MDFGEINNMNTKLMFSSTTDLWATPQDFFDKLDKIFHFQVDVCATAENAKCAKYYTEETNGLAQDWTGVCWLNPPYGGGYRHGLPRLIIVPRKMGQPWYVYCQHEQIPAGGMITA